MRNRCAFPLVQTPLLRPQTNTQGKEQGSRGGSAGGLSGLEETSLSKGK